MFYLPSGPTESVMGEAVQIHGTTAILMEKKSLYQKVNLLMLVRQLTGDIPIFG